MNTKQSFLSIFSVVLIFALLGCQKKQEKILDARALSKEERASGNFVPYYPAKQPSHTFRNHIEEMAWQVHFDKLSPKLGMDAPDFELFDASGKESFKLSSFEGKKPVALIFGSFT